MTQKIAILAADGFEDSEVVEPFTRLREAGFKVLIVGPVEGQEIVGKRGDFKITVDISVDAVKVSDFDALVIPGGYSPDRLRLNDKAIDFARDFQLALKPVAAICHGPQLLISADTVKGRTLTASPSVAVDIKNAGGNYVDEPVVIDGNLITSRKPADLPQFINAIIATFEEKEEQLTA